MKIYEGVKNCRDCYEVINGYNEVEGMPLCSVCNRKYADEFARIKKYVKNNGFATKEDLHKYLQIPMKVIGYLMDKPEKEAPARATEVSNLKLSKTFLRDDKLISLKLTHKDIIEGAFTNFIMLGDEYSVPLIETIFLEDLQPGERIRHLRAVFSPNNPEALTNLLKDGAKFIIYFENESIIFPAEVSYFQGRPSLIQIMPNKIHPKIQRAQRVKINKPSTVLVGDLRMPIMVNDLSKTGISFYSEVILGSPGDRLKIKAKEIVLVDRQRLNANNYFYRGYFA